MKNLHLLYNIQGNAEPIKNASTSECNEIWKCITIDECSGLVYAGSSTGRVTCLTIVQASVTVKLVVDMVAEGFLLNSNDDSIIALEWLNEQFALCICTRFEIWLWTASNGVESVGVYETPLHCMSWSPDQSVVAFMSDEGEAGFLMTLMSRDLEPFSTSMLLQSQKEEEVEGIAVNVGWGSRETQFHGSVGKSAAHQTFETKENTLNQWDVGQPLVAWRSDGTLLATSFVASSEFGLRRSLRIWSAEGREQASAAIKPEEQLSGLCAALTWRNQRLLVAQEQFTVKELLLQTVERNGLAHGPPLVLPLMKDSCVVRQLLCNKDAQLLAVVTEQTLTKQQLVQIWSCSNYHWYLKSQFCLGDGVQVAALRWDAGHWATLHLLGSDGRYSQMRWAWQVSKAVVSGGSALVAVIDGQRILLTPLEHMLVPPPMCAYAIRLPFCAIQVALHLLEDEGLEELAVFLADNSLRLYLWSSETAREALMSQPMEDDHLDMIVCKNDGFAQRCKPPCRMENVVNACWRKGTVELDKTVNSNCNVRQLLLEREGFDPDLLIKLTDEQAWRLLVCRVSLREEEVAGNWSEDEGTLHHLTWVTSGHLVLIRGLGKKQSLLQLLRDPLTGTWLCLESALEGVDDPIITVNALQQSSNLRLQDARGVIMELRYDCWPRLISLVCTLPQACPFTQICTIDVATKTCIIQLGLAENFRLYADNTELHTACTSFIILSEYLLVTSLQHELRCIPLRMLRRCSNVKAALDVMGKRLTAKDDVHRYDPQKRALERGARIIGVAPNDCRVILQMPRGNLEAVHPRCLVLLRVTALCASQRWAAAMQLLRRHRVNLNLLCDFRPACFRAHVLDFVREIREPHLLNIFVSDLLAEDVTTTMYRTYFEDNEDKSSIGSVHDEDCGCGAVTPAHPNYNKVNEITRLILVALDASDESLLTTHFWALSVLACHARAEPPAWDKALLYIRAMHQREQSTSAAQFSCTAEAAMRFLLVLSDVRTVYRAALNTYDLSLALMVAQTTDSNMDPRDFLPFLEELRKLDKEPYRRFKIDIYLGHWRLALRHLIEAGPNAHMHELLQFVEKHHLETEALAILQQEASQGADVSNVQLAIAENLSTRLLAKGDYYNAGMLLLSCGTRTQSAHCFRRARNWRLWLVSLPVGGVNPEEARQFAEDLRNSGRHEDGARLLADPAVNLRMDAMIMAAEAGLWDEALRLKAAQVEDAAFCEATTNETLLSILLRTLRQTEERLARVQQNWVCHETRLREVRRLRVERQRQRILLEEADEPAAELFSEASSSFASSTSSSARSSSSTGSRGTAKSRRKTQRKQHSLRQGSRHEEAALLEALAALCTEVTGAATNEVRQAVHGALLLHRAHDAARLQASLGQVMQLFRKDLGVIWPLTLPREQTPLLGGANSSTTLDMSSATALIDMGVAPQAFLFLPPQSSSALTISDGSHLELLADFQFHLPYSDTH